jgi:Alpha/beta hydrolase domain containing 18
MSSLDGIRYTLKAVTWLGEMYTEWLARREHDLAFRTNDRVVRPFEWGEEWTRSWPLRGLVQNGHGPESYIRSFNEIAVSNADRFLAYEPVSHFALEGNLLRFPSAVVTPYPNNNEVRALWFPAKASRRAVVLVPHWNSRLEQKHVLATTLQKLGISVLRLSLPYHDSRMPPELRRADFAVSSNICRTIDAGRQAILDIRCCYDWLETQGYNRLGLLGVSLGSCYGFTASAHDPRIKTNVLIHCGSSFADIVWSGLSTQHVRAGLEKGIDLARLRGLWQILNPVTHLPHFAEKDKRTLLVYCLHDTTVSLQYSRQLISESHKLGLALKSVAIPCGHYTLGEAPFKYLAGYLVSSFLRREL